MKMSTLNAERIQWFLNVLIDDGLCCAFLLTVGNPSPWQFSVEAIYRLVMCDIIIFDPDVLIKDPRCHETTYENIDDFCMQLSNSIPYEDNIWYVSEASLTPKGRSLIELYFKDFDTEQINVPFIEHLERIFAEHQVPWDEENPRFPVDVSKLQQSSKKNTSSADQD
ncbi:hypothetical protein LU290_07455 [Moraxella nasibovis]|uniref:hypothetical protein n=1 Tax=Moraxella nasibovis TaxID=2904120 RepID=UPI00240EC8EC|nr:hypothetical protein [Moraxella nasibovis]WFF38094.1 hypothetical protein LU290_07455 [Moraxella nasibovis]